MLFVGAFLVVGAIVGFVFGGLVLGGLVGLVLDGLHATLHKIVRKINN